MVDSLFIDAKWIGDKRLSEEAIAFLIKNNVKKVALFAAVNFLDNADVKDQLLSLGFEVLITRAKRTHKEGQVLGCDSYHNSYKDDIMAQADMLLYIGDGMFHPEALLFSQMYQGTNKQVMCWNPVEQKITIIDAKNVAVRRKKLKANLMRFLTSKTIGVLVTLKPGQQFLSMAQALKKKFSEEGKKVYVFIDDTFEYKRMEDYSFVDVWVNTACPRIGQDDIIHMPKPLININEALAPERYLEMIARAEEMSNI